MAANFIFAAFRRIVRRTVKLALTPLAQFVRRRPGLKRRAVKLLQRFPMIDAQVYSLFHERDATRPAPPNPVQSLGELPPRGRHFLHILKSVQPQESRGRD